MSELSRRKFIQLSVISSAVASGLAGCKNEAIWEEESAGQYGGSSDKAYPYINQPDGTTDGVPTYFATTCQMCPAGCGIYVRTLGGRANKIEGNPYNPVSGGKSCLRGQLALQHLYNPDRLMHPCVKSMGSRAPIQSSWDIAMQELVDRLASSRGAAAIVIDGETIARSPTKMALVRKLSASMEAQIVSYSLIDDAPWRAASAIVYGKDQLPDYRLDLADLIISFGGNFLEAWPSPVYYGRLFGEFRQGARRSPGNHGRFVYVGPRMSMTAAKADEWIPCTPGTEAFVAQGILNALGEVGLDLATASAMSGVDASVIVSLAAAIKRAGPSFAAIGGDGLYASSQITESFVAVEQLNVAAKSGCVRFGAPLLPAIALPAKPQAMNSLVRDMAAGNVRGLLFIGEVNPLFGLPAVVGWQTAMEKVPYKASISSFLNESTATVDIALPVRTFLEEWGDFVPSVLPSGVQLGALTQPVIDPTYITRRYDVDSSGNPKSMMDTREMNDILIDLLNRLRAVDSPDRSIDVVRKTWSAVGGATLTEPDFNNDEKWVDLVSNGGKWPAVTAGNAKGKAAFARLDVQTRPQGSFSLQLYPHLYYGDGRHASLNWAQEMPDPMSSSVWNSWVEINPAIAHALGIRTGDVVRLTSSAGSIELPAVPYPGIHPDALAIPLGQGHTEYGRNASGVGVNPLTLVENVADKTTGAMALCAMSVSMVKVRDAAAGFHRELNTLVLVQDRPHGDEPAEVMGLIHQTAQEWRAEQGHAATKSTSRPRPII
jgi:anaerobic selenocysteine-containing dehydrogenase